jgi:hypothetical protein
MRWEIGTDKHNLQNRVKQQKNINKAIKDGYTFYDCKIGHKSN